MNISQRLLTNNDCYKAGRKITPKGIMVHSTGANNPKLSRYIQPDDSVLGVNANKNDWNQRGLDRCVHAFIGKDKNGNVKIYQTLPWNYRGWHGGGKSNDTHIGFEICEDGLTDPIYFHAVYKLAVELCVYLCKTFNLQINEIIGHYEGYQRGIASNHSDPKHWFSRHGKSMDTLRADVKKELEVVTVSYTDKVVVPNTAYWQAQSLVQEYQKRGFKCYLNPVRLHETQEDGFACPFVVETNFQYANMVKMELETKGYSAVWETI
jgi:N-acetylmuramoyl-L-alanine amidase